MKKIIFFNRLKENVRGSMASLAYVFMIALLTCACASTDKKQTSPYAIALDQILTEGESENSETNDDQEIVCRTREITGSRFKEKVCATKAEWAELDKKNRAEADYLDREIDRRTSVGA